MTVSIAGTLPEGDKNGLQHHESLLAAGRLEGAKHLVVGVVEVRTVKETAKNDWRPEPVVTFDHVEVALDPQTRDVVKGILVRLFQSRVGAPLPGIDDLLSGATESRPEPVVPLAVTADVTYGFRVSEPDETGRLFRLSMVTRSGAVVLSRGNLSVETYGVPPGDYSLEELGSLSGILASLAQILVREWTLDHGDDNIDVEVVEPDRPSAVRSPFDLPDEDDTDGEGEE